MSKLKLLLLASLTLICLTAFTQASSAPVYAVDVTSPTCPDSSGNGNCSGPCNNPDATSQPTICKDITSGQTTNPIYGANGIIALVVRILSIIIGIAAIFMIIISGMRMVFGGGSPETVNSARDGIIYALIGLVVAGFAQVMITFVLNKV